MSVWGLKMWTLISISKRKYPFLNFDNSDIMSIKVSRIRLEILRKCFARKIFYQKAFLGNLNDNCRAGILTEFWFELIEINVCWRNPLFMVACTFSTRRAKQSKKTLWLQLSLLEITWYTRFQRKKCCTKRRTRLASRAFSQGREICEHVLTCGRPLQLRTATSIFYSLQVI